MQTLPIARSCNSIDHMFKRCMVPWRPLSLMHFVIWTGRSFPEDRSIYEDDDIDDDNENDNDDDDGEDGQRWCGRRI